MKIDALKNALKDYITKIGNVLNVARIKYGMDRNVFQSVKKVKNIKLYLNLVNVQMGHIGKTKSV